MPFPFSFLLDATMTAQIIDGKALAEELRQGFKARVEALTAKGHRPGLVVILVGADPASEVYVRNKVNGCLAIGMHSEKITFGPSCRGKSRRTRPVNVLDFLSPRMPL